MQAVIELTNVWKIYQIGDVKVEALRGMNLTVKKGEFLALMGPSGSGKSTAVNMIGCLDIPTTGTIFLEHHNIAHMTESELAQIRGKKIGFVFQQFNLIPTLTALENVMMPMMFQDTIAESRKKAATELLEQVGLANRINHLPKELSGGQQQRVAIARALANNPEVVLADEPTGNLDSTTGKEVMAYLRKLHKEQNKTIIMVTHDLHLAKIADRIAHLKDGIVMQ